jgi:phosphocarrier protein
MRLEKELLIKNELGLHIRPAATIAKLVQQYDAQVFFTYENEKVNAKSVMGLLMLMAKKGAKIYVTIEGKDAQKAYEALKKAFENRFEELI